jgi:hypothetical protein
MQRPIAIVSLAGAIACGSALAQDAANRGGKDEGSALELTMALIPANAQSPAAVTATIELPKNDSTGAYIPSAQGVEHSADGLDTANLAREEGREFGEATAEAARENRENAGRAPRDPPGSEPPPAPPETPDRPGPPAR